MEIHHTKHHQAYITKLNEALLLYRTDFKKQEELYEEHKKALESIDIKYRAKEWDENPLNPNSKIAKDKVAGEAAELASKRQKIEEIRQLSNTVGRSLSALNDLANANADNRINASEKNTDRAIRNSKRLADAEIANLRRSGKTEEQISQQALEIEKRRVEQENALLIAADELYNKEKQKEFNRNKALKAAQLGIDTAAAVATYSLTPATIPLAIAAGITGAAGIAAILATKYNARESSLSDVPDVSVVAGTVGVPNAQSTRFDEGLFNTNSPNRGTNNNTNPNDPFGTQRVIVLESDITRVQDRVRVIENGASFG
jgi:hypothetical protein